MASSQLSIVSVNCKAVISHAIFIADLCTKYDIVMLQETWLLPTNLHFLNTINPTHNSVGTSAVDTSQGILRGRPHGGVAILYRNSLRTRSIDCGTPRLAAIEISVTPSKTLLIVSVYMPCESVDNFPEYCTVLGRIHALVEEYDTADCIIMGDFNADPRKSFGRELEAFCTEFDFKFVDRLRLADDSYSYVSPQSTTSWLDHCLVTAKTYAAVHDVAIDYTISWTDHRPLSINITTDGLTPLKVNTTTLNDFAWRPRSVMQISHYMNMVEQSISNYLPDKDSTMDTTSLNHLCEKIITTMQKAAKAAFKRKGRHHIGRKVTGWNDYVAKYYAASKQALALWHESGRPTDNEIAAARKKCRAEFKNALKKCQQQRDQIVMDKLATSLNTRNFSDFWIKTNRQIKPRSVVPSHIDGITDTKQISEHFSTIFTQPAPTRDSQSQTVPARGITADLRNVDVTLELVWHTVKYMARGKSPGLDGLSIEHVQNGGPALLTAITALYKNIINTSHIPDILARTVVTPIVKNQKKDISSSSNYRPIALASILARVLEKVLHTVTAPYLETEPNQMGFKKSVSTVSAIYTLKQVAHYYKRMKTSVYACFLDLSKAFDRVDHQLLWSKLRDRGTPEALVRVLSTWYNRQNNVVRWSGALSTPTGLACGVRQGGCMSPALFNVYMDDLNKELTATKVGCSLNGTMINNVCYADDMVLLAPSVSAMRRLLSVCEAYAKRHNMSYNPDKSECVIFESANTPSLAPPLWLGGRTLRRVDEVRYLGHMITSRLNDDSDIERQRRAITVRANMLARRFQRCSSEVKRQLFLTFCTSVYTVELWCSHTVETMRRMRVAYNNAWRALYRLPPWCSASGMFAAGRAPGWAALLRLRSAGARERIACSTNPILMAARQWAGSPLHRVWDDYQAPYRD